MRAAGPLAASCRSNQNGSNAATARAASAASSPAAATAPLSRIALHPHPNGAGLSRKEIMSKIDHSPRRLGTDYVDL
jgi:hypothetical protein